MNTLRYVCLSDVHFGAANSLLTHVDDDACTAAPTEPSPGLRHLIECLRLLVGALAGDRKPTLVLHGDVLDLALSNLSHAGMAFERFVELAWPAQGEPLFDSRVIYVPGNHDHDLWRTASQHLYRQDVVATPPGQQLPTFRHATSMFTIGDIASVLLTELVARGSGRRAEVTTVYPDLGLLSPDHSRCVVISHGHYIESIYLAQSWLLGLLFPDHRMPEDIASVERENGTWIDYFWSTMGNTGKFGEDIALVYDKLQDPRQTRALFRTFAGSLAAIRREPRWERWVDTFALDAAVDAVCGRMAGLARNQTDDLLSADARRGLRWYLEHPVLSALRRELDGHLPADVTFVFGHTHKPFQAVDTFAGYDAPVKLFNSGGWVVDTPQPNPIEGGAVIVIDDALNAASLRMYNEAADAASYSVKVEDAGSATGRPGPLCEALRAKIDPAADPWATFSVRAAREVSRRATQLQTLMKRNV